MKPYRCNQCLQKHYRSGECGLAVWAKDIGDVFLCKLKDMESRLAGSITAFEELADTTNQINKDFQRLNKSLETLRAENTRSPFWYVLAIALATSSYIAAIYLLLNSP